MARVNVERSVFHDPRYKVLARELGITKWDAIARMALVWDHCQETHSYVLSIEDLNLLHDDVEAFAEAALKAGLARKHRHGLYISGTKGRIEWLENKRRANRENGKLGGRPKKTHNKPTKNPRGLQAETTPAPAPAPAPAVEAESKSSRPTSSTSDTPRRIFDDESREMKAARYLFRKVLANNPAAKAPNFQTWARSFDLIFRVDERDAEQVRKLIDWSQKDEFWLKNILSPNALRKHFDKLTLASERPSSAPPIFTPAPRKSE